MSLPTPISHPVNPSHAPSPQVRAPLPPRTPKSGTSRDSLRKIIQTLRPLQRITVRIAGHDHIAADPLPPTATTIINALK